MFTNLPESDLLLDFVDNGSLSSCGIMEQRFHDLRTDQGREGANLFASYLSFHS